MPSRQRGITRSFVAQEQHMRELNTLHAATVALLNTIELDVLLDKVLTVAMRAIPAAEKSLLLLTDQSTGQMHVRAARGYTDARLRPQSFLQPTGHLARAIRERSPLLVESPPAEHSLRYRADIPELRAVGSSIVAPLLLDDYVIGLLVLDSTQRRVFNKSDLRLLAAFASTASVAIRNAQLHAEVQRQAVTDHLTGLYNRRGFFELGQRELERARRFKHPLAAILFDLDRFKRINDTYGHIVGDRVIYAVAERARKCLRHIDLLGRYGGEEFVALLPETDIAMLYQVGERLRQCIAEKPIETERGPVPVTISLGVTVAGEDANVVNLINRADSAMYAAKQMGGNYLVVR